MATFVATPAQPTFASEGTNSAEIVVKCQIGARTSLIGLFLVQNEDGSISYQTFNGSETLWVSRLEWFSYPTRSAQGIAWYVLSSRSPANPGGGKLIYTWGWQNVPYCPTYRRVL